MDPATIRDQIERILHSQNLAGKGQLKKLLEDMRKRGMDQQGGQEGQQQGQEQGQEQGQGQGQGQSGQLAANPQGECAD